MLYTFYNSDSGNRDLGPERTFSCAYSEAAVIAEAKRLAIKYHKTWIIIVRTSAWGKKPGAWYIKGYKSKLDYDAVKANIEANVTGERYARRTAILVRLTAADTLEVFSRQDICYHHHAERCDADWSIERVVARCKELGAGGFVRRGDSFCYIIDPTFASTYAELKALQQTPRVAGRGGLRGTHTGGLAYTSYILKE